MIEQRKVYLKQWGNLIYQSATRGRLGKAMSIGDLRMIAGPRVGAVLLHAGLDSDRLLRALSRNNAAILRQFIPWQFTGEPQAFMSGRFVRVEAGWSEDLAESMVRLSDIGQKPEGNGRWVLGKNEHGATIIPGLHDQTPHFLIAGATGSGKSVALQSAVLQFCRDGHNEIVMIDGKYGESLGRLAHLRGVQGPVAVDAETTRQALGWACSRMRERYQGNTEGKVIIVWDEFQELADDPAVVAMFRKLVAQGRAAGVHMLAATQHPTVDAFGDSSTRRNLVGKIALRVGDPDASRVAVGGKSPRADHLLGKGDTYFLSPQSCERVQGAFVDNRDIENAPTWDVPLAEWPDLDLSDIGEGFRDTPNTGGRPRRELSTAEIAAMTVTALEEEGRVALAERLVELGVKPGSNGRLSKLVKQGKEVLEHYDTLGYILQ